ncbi:hypothetical protein BY458DRAFT_532995 [Sporodiniella umbellata]|nr:hypothetical protein BY458DRAFT_532995 [Sporodiniella umbellata]
MNLPLTHFSLTLIYESLKAPNSLSAKTVCAQFSSATVKLWDHSFRHWHHCTKHKGWTATKLIRCLDYMVTHMAPAQQAPVFELPSFQHCLKWLLVHLPEDPVQVQTHVKCLAHLLELKADPIQKAFAQRGSIQRWLLTWACSESTLQAIRYYCIRALSHLELLEGSTPALVQLMNRVLESDEAVMIARLLGNQPTFEIDDHWLSLWERSMKYYTLSSEPMKKPAGILYSITHLLNQAASRSATSRRKLAEAHWKPFDLLTLLTRRWCQTLAAEGTQGWLAEEEQVLIKTWRLIYTEADVLPQTQAYGPFVQSVVDLLNCLFMAFLSQGVLAEPNTFKQWSNYQLCIELDARDLEANFSYLQKHEKLLTLFLDVYIQYVQILPYPESPDVIAWCLKTFLLLLHEHETSPLLPKLKKLVIYFLHIEKAIEVLVGAPKLISHSIWQPTLELAREGLTTIACVPEEELESIDIKRSSTIYKADRALVSLELVAQNPRGCERLVEAEVLGLMNFIFDEFRWAPSLLTFYGNFVRLMATLTGRSAFVRVRLREQSRLFPKIKNLLKTAIVHPRDKGCLKLIKGCLLVIISFQYDTTSMQQWLSEDSIVPPVLELVFPWPAEASQKQREECFKHHKETMGLASYVLNEVLGHSLGIRQLTEYPQALYNLCQVALASDAFGDYGLTLHATSCRLLCNAPIMSHVFHLFFRPVIQRPRISDQPHSKLCQYLYQCKLQDFLKMYTFAQTHDDSALKLHEMAAVAIGYASIGQDPKDDWLMTVCQMLVYPVESLLEDDIRRSTAAQVIEILSLDFIWPLPMPRSVVWKSIECKEPVGFVTDDGQKVEASRSLMKEVSPIFHALLSQDYIESEMTRIPLRDVTFHSLNEFVALIHRINADQTALAKDYEWTMSKSNGSRWRYSVSRLAIYRYAQSQPQSTLTQSLSSLRTLVITSISLISSIYGHPLSTLSETAEEPDIDYGSPEFYEKLLLIFGLVLLGGVFAGLTIGLMGMDETNLQVLIQTGTVKEKENAQKVLRLLARGKHWVLVTLLLSNVIVNETLPIILDGVLGGGWKAVVISTALIVIFGEVIPQSICVRYGLAIGAKTSGMVLALMYVMYPIAYPTALLLDYFLGESHGTIYKKAGLKTLVSLHQSVNPSDVDALTEDEVTIIGAVLDLRSKPVSQIMTPIADVFTLSTDDILDEKSIQKILTAGYSRIPIHTPHDPMNFVGMLLTKKLITYDPEDAHPVKDFQISTLPETGPDTSCLDILNFFQEGKSHMALITNNPGGQMGALGVITLEDVIEELIGEEIIDETDVYVDGKQQPSICVTFLISFL